jgi:DNA-binding XRE family transcriptional regulator
MGRPAKNPANPLTRLRKALSTPTQEMTRAIFSKKVGIPEATIKALETGKFKLSDKNAAQIAAAITVDPKCLTDPGLPLTDYMGFPYEGDPVAAEFGEEFLDIKVLIDAAFEVAEEKGKQAFFLFLFQRWLEETSEILGLGRAISDKLQDRYPLQCFGAIPEYFWPRDRKQREEVEKRVKRFEKELTAEVIKASSPPEEPSLKKMEREETAKVNPEEATTDPEAFLERWNKAQEAAVERYFKFLKEGLRHRFVKNYSQLARDLRNKMIEEAKASLQKEPKRLRTR